MSTDPADELTRLTEQLGLYDEPIASENDPFQEATPEPVRTRIEVEPSGPGYGGALDTHATTSDRLAAARAYRPIDPDDKGAC